MKGNKTINHTGFSMRQFLHWLVFVLTLCIHPGAFAQLSRGGTPIGTGALRSSCQWINLDEVRVDAFLLEDQADAIRGMKNHRVARAIPVSLTPEGDGTWEWLPDGTRIWRLGIRAAGARALGIVFNRYFLEEGARLFLYDPAMRKVLGAYSMENNKSTAIFPVGYLPGEELIIQLEMPPGIIDYGELQIGTVRFAYLPVFQEKSLNDDYFGRADTCNVDVNCLPGNDWQELKRSVVRLINNELCSGVLVNNTNQDGKPYILTGAHCVFDRFTGEYQPSVFYFNYESPSCDGPDGNDQFSIAGATLVATGDTSENPRDADSLDFALLELSVTPPDSFMPYYAGWNRGKSPAQQTTSIHHPRGDVKKISRDYDPPETSYHEEDYLPDLVKYSHWRIRRWDLGTTEGGSSGCPLFDQNQRVVGTLTGGAANCANPVNDYYTKFDYAWDYYDAPAKQLKHWLDPAGTGTLVMGGWKPLTDKGPAPAEERPLRIYPNPADGLLQVQTDLPGHGNIEISVFHISGTLLMQTSSAQTAMYILDVSQLAPGSYILRLCRDRNMSNQRFIIAR
jgi:lysyl endopeptidase